MFFKRYGRLYWRFLKTNLIREIQFRSNFWIVNIVTLLWSATIVLYYVFIFQHVSSVKGWTLGKVLVLTGIYLLFNSVFKSLLEINFNQFVQIIYNGELDYVLTKPVNSQFLVSLSRFSLRSFLRLFAGLGILIWALLAYDIKISVLGVAVFLISFLLGMVIIYSLWFITFLLAFYLGNIENLYYLFLPIFQMARVPITVFPKTVQILFSFVIPLIFIATIPAQALWGNASWQILLLGVILTLGLLWLSHYLWLRALRSYSSASS